MPTGAPCPNRVEPLPSRLHVKVSARLFLAVRETRCFDAVGGVQRPQVVALLA